MRFLLFLLCSLAVSLSATAFVGEKPAFKIEQNQAAQALTQLDQLEALLIENPNLTPAELAEKAAALNASGQLAPEFTTMLATLAPSSDYRDEFFHLPAFWFAGAVTCVGWCASIGLILGPIAVVYVYINSDHDGQATLEALGGCTAANVLTIGVIVGYVMAINAGQPGW